VIITEHYDDRRVTLTLPIIQYYKKKYL